MPLHHIFEESRSVKIGILTKKNLRSTFISQSVNDYLLLEILLLLLRYILFIIKIKVICLIYRSHFIL